MSRKYNGGKYPYKYYRRPLQAVEYIPWNQVSEVITSTELDTEEVEVQKDYFDPAEFVFKFEIGDSAVLLRNENLIGGLSGDIVTIMSRYPDFCRVKHQSGREWLVDNDRLGQILYDEVEEC